MQYVNPWATWEDHSVLTAEPFNALPSDRISFGRSKLYVYLLSSVRHAKTVRCGTHR
jgi:hypothetical protein